MKHTTNNGTAQPAGNEGDDAKLLEVRTRLDPSTYDRLKKGQKARGLKNLSEYLRQLILEDYRKNRYLIDATPVATELTKKMRRLEAENKKLKHNVSELFSEIRRLDAALQRKHQ